MISNLAKLNFKELNINRENYISWQLDAKIHLQSKKLGEAIKEGNKMSPENKVSALIFLCYHIHDNLKNEYQTDEYSAGLWKSLNYRYDHQKMVILPVA